MSTSDKQRLHTIIKEVFSKATPELIALVKQQTWTRFQAPVKLKQSVKETFAKVYASKQFTAAKAHQAFCKK